MNYSFKLTILQNNYTLMREHYNQEDSDSYPAPVESPGQVVSRPEGQHGHGGLRAQLEFIQH